MKELIFFDVDDTLLDSHSHQIPASTIEALHALRKHYSLGIATGRSLSTLYDNGVMDAIDWDVFICNNGQLVYDRNKQELFRNPIAHDVVQRVLHVAKQEDIPLLIGTPDWHLYGEITEPMRIAHGFFQIPIPAPVQRIDQDVFMMVAYQPYGSTYAPLADIDGIQLMIGQSTYCDIIAKDAGKHLAIQKALKHYGLDSYLAFGDSNNDLGMLKNARYAIVMGQGSELAKKEADFITKAVHEDGIAYALAHCPIFMEVNV